MSHFNLFTIAGLWRLIRNFLKKPHGGEILLVMWCMMMYGAVTAWIPLDWDRYYLPAAAGVAVLSGIGIHAVLEKIIRPIGRKLIRN